MNERLQIAAKIFAAQVHRDEFCFLLKGRVDKERARQVKLKLLSLSFKWADELIKFERKTREELVK